MLRRALKIAVIGIGQSLRGDDAAGLATVRRWQENNPQTANRQNVRVELSELPGLGLLDLLEGAQAAILVDAVRSGATPGTIHRLRLEELSAFSAGSKTSHGWGVAETLELERLLNPDRKRIAIRLIGIEAGQIQISNELSPAVLAALPSACEAVQEEIGRLL